MIRVHHLMVTLSGCVLVCSNLDKKLSEVSGIQEASGDTHHSAIHKSVETGTSEIQAATGLLVERIKWALWKDERDC